ncbi:hypothetical protein B0J13DRAFT_523728 [Dactylonectria estremocensis]|uniref:BZIP domain-containing protein n=1 Tax=Dactylonectria estremocensis TaxID=1079267 RepID=A0A9P9JAG6_9HYPO|nr:hypothetical protein B0J13DRAFT_523728 [Dactylonectria estremocensis]
MAGGGAWELVQLACLGIFPLIFSIQLTAMEDSQAARRGRPPIQDGQDAVNSQQKKRLRMRLAQRSYRARKQVAQESETVRAEELSSALDNALATFSTFHQRLLNTSPIRNSPDLLTHLNDAAAQMAAIASGANKVLSLPHALENPRPRSRQQAPGMSSSPLATAATGELHNEWSSELFLTGGRILDPSVTVDFGATTISLRTNTSNQIPVSARVIRACFERVVSLLSNGTVYGNQPLALALPLQLLGEEVLMYNSLQGLSLLKPRVADFLYPLHSAPRLPHLYRVVEGGTQTVSRAPAPFVQQIVRGKTRTMLDTNFAPLQGEWLETLDVEEYLEERGIYLRNTVLDDTTSTHGTMHRPLTTGSEQNIPILALPRLVAGRELAQGFNNDMPLQPNIVEQRPSAASLLADFSGHEPVDYSVFWPRSANSQLHSATMAAALATDASGVLQSDSNHQTAEAIEDASRITVDLDKLVHLLAENATCLGPVPGIRKGAVDASIRGSVILA